MRIDRRRWAKGLRRDSKLRATGRRRRTSMVEMLEGRELLAADAMATPWHNAINPNDVNRDNRVSPYDALLVINDLMVNGTRSVPATPQSQNADATASEYLDVTGDNIVSPLDALNIINLLAGEKGIEISVTPTDLGGTPITSISVGNDFLLQATVTDIRSPVNDPAGVFAAYLNVTYDSGLASISPSATFTFDPFFPVTRTFDISTPGLVAGAGAAAASLLPPETGNAPQKLWTVLVHASAGGVVTFTPSFDSTLGHEVLLYGLDDVLQADNIEFVGASLTINQTSTLSVAGTSQNEGNTGTTPFVFTVSLSTPSENQVTVQYNTATPGAGNVATPGVDYVATSGTLTFAPSQTTQLVTVLVNGDLTIEPNEIFNVQLSNPTGAELSTSSTATGTILNDDFQSFLTIGDETEQALSGSSTDMVFTVTLAPAASTQLTVAFATSDVTASAGSDYTATSGTLTFAPGVTTQFITVSILGDTVPENTETFQVTLSDPSGNGVLQDGTAVGTILPAAAIPNLTVNNVQLNEGNSGQTNFVFTASLSAPAPQEIVIAYATADATAMTADNDYVPTSGTLTFAVGESTKLITVAVVGDANVEGDETFAVNLSLVSGSVGNLQTPAVGTILNDDGTPAIGISDVTVVAAGTGTTNAVFTISLSLSTSEVVTVSYSTQDGTATAPGDYQPQSGNVTFAPLGPLTQTITVPVVGKQTPEPDETFFVNLSAATGGAEIDDPQGVGTIVRQGLTIGNVSVAEGNSGTTNAVFTVNLSQPQDHIVTVAFSTANNTATTADNDYIATSGTLTFGVGQTNQLVTVGVVGDVAAEATETFFVNLSNPTGTVILSGQGTGSIVNDDNQKVLIRLEVADTGGNPLGAGETLGLNEDFLLRAYVQDVQAVPHGIAAAYLDVLYSSGLVSLNGPITFGPNFPFIQSGNTATLGLIDEVGAFGNLTPPADPGAPQLLFSVLFTTIGLGEATFDADPADAQEHQVLEYTNDLPIPPNAISFVGDTVTITETPTISVAGVSQAEGNSGTTPFVFTVSLSNPFNQTATVQYATANPVSGNIATPGVDYQATSGTLTFAPGQTEQLVTVLVNGDVTVEPDEIFNLQLSNPTGGELGPNAVATGTIVNDDFQSAINIGDAQVNNVTSGTTNMVFTVTLTPAAASQITVQFATSDVTATAGSDYTATSGTLTFAAGVATQTITVSVIGDPLPEQTETFLVTLSNPTGNSVLQDAEAVGTIIPAVPFPDLAIAGVQLSEGNSGTKNFVFTATLSTPAPQPIVVAFATANGTATTANNDYVATSGTLSFAVGESSKTITVAVVGDTNIELDETFLVNLTPVSGPIGNIQSPATGTIINDDGTPTITINDVLVSPGASGITNAVFTVSLSLPTSEVVTVGFSTQDGTATAPQDYQAQSGNLTFVPGGAFFQTITVPVVGSPVAGPDETFLVNLSSVTGTAVIGDSQGIGTIVRQGLSISSPTVVEGNSGITNAIFTVSLSQAQDHVVTVAFSTADGTATVANSDYNATSGTLSFAVGQTSRLVTVAVRGDTIVEANETFFVNLSNSNGASILSQTGTATIINDDGQKALIQLVVADTNGVPLAPGAVLDLNANFLLQAYVQDIQVEPHGIAAAYLDALYDSNLVMVNGPITYGPAFPSIQSGDTGTPGIVDEVGAFGQLTPPANPGAPQLLFSIPFTTIDVGLASFVADPADAAEHEVLEYTSDLPIPTAAVNYVGASVNIGENVLAVNRVSQAEGNGGLTGMVFTVTRFLPSAETATVQYATTNGTAIAGTDYVATSGTLTFAPGQSTMFITVPIIGDLTDEPDETFNVVLSNAVGALQSQSPGVGTILDDDAPVGISISPATGNESTSLQFTVTLSAVSGKTVTVAYATADATSGNLATAGVDYQPVSGVLTFAPGTTQQTISVAALGDIVIDPNEVFLVVLSNPTNATLTTPQALGTIIDVPPAVITGYVYLDLNGNGIKEASEKGIAGATVRATRSGSGDTYTAITDANGLYTMTGVFPGTYTITESQPGFYLDGRDTHLGVDSPLNDQFSGVVLAPSQVASGYNFGESGVRQEFLSIFLSRRAFFASTVVNGHSNVPATNVALDLRMGDLWVSFDGGWLGTRAIEAIFDATQGTANLTLYNNAVQPVAVSLPTSNGAVLTYTGTTGGAYFLRISGTNPSVSLQAVDSMAISNATQVEGNSGTTNFLFTVAMSAPKSQTVTVNYATTNGTATVASGDYSATSGTLTFAPGQTMQVITVAVNGDTISEGDETFLVTLSGATNVTIGQAVGIGTIVNDDAFTMFSTAPSLNGGSGGSSSTTPSAAALGVTDTTSAALPASAPASVAMAGMATVSLAPESSSATDLVLEEDEDWLIDSLLA